MFMSKVKLWRYSAKKNCQKVFRQQRPFFIQLYSKSNNKSRLMILMDNILNTMGKVQLLYDSGNFVLIEKKGFQNDSFVPGWTMDTRNPNPKYENGF